MESSKFFFQIWELFSSCFLTSNLWLITFFSSFSAAAFGAVLHVISTSLLGITAITMATTIASEETVHRLASLLLLVLGGSYILLFALGKGGHNHSHGHPMEKVAVAGLVLVPALSPCATTLPVFLAVGNSSSMIVLAIIVLLFRYLNFFLLKEFLSLIDMLEKICVSYL